MATNNAINANSTTPMIVSIGGTGANTLTIHGLLKGDATGAVSALAAATNGQLPIGSTGADPVLGTLTAGTGISIANGAGTITIGSLVSQGIVTLDGNTGAATGTTVTLDATTNSGASTTFTGSGSTVALSIGDTGSGNCFVGSGSGNGTASGNNNTCLGIQVMPAITTASYNTGIGFEALESIVDSNDNAGLGRGSLANLSTGSGLNTAVGNGALIALSSGDNNIALGYFAGQNYTTTETSNIVIGSLGTAAENNVIRIGTQGSGAGQQNLCFVAGIHGVTPGGSGIQTVTIDSNGQLGSTAGGGGGITTLAGDTGSATGSTITIAGLAHGGSSVSFSASGATMDLNIGDFSGFRNCIVGDQAGNGSLSGADNTSLGVETCAGLTSGGSNTALGSRALSTLSDSDKNVAIGAQSMLNATHASENVAVGYQTLINATTGTKNIAIGYQAADSIDVGQENIMIGADSGFITGASFNIAIGSDAGTNCVTGTEISNIYISNAGVNGENNTIRLGTQGTGSFQQNACFIAGIAGTTVASTAAVLVNTSTGQLGTIISSRRFKDRITDMGDRSSRVMQLRPVNFSYKQDSSNGIQWGLIAEEVAEVMPEIVTYDMLGEPYTVRYQDMPAILLNELQKLTQRVQLLEAQLIAVKESK